MGLSVLDSSVLVAFLDAHDSLHQQATRALAGIAAVHALVVPVVAYAEVMVGAFVAGDRAVRQAQAFFDGSTRIEPLTPATARLGAQLRARHRLGMPDALVLATGIELGAAEIVTGDRSWRKIDRRVKVIA